MTLKGELGIDAPGAGGTGNGGGRGRIGVV